MLSELLDAISLRTPYLVTNKLVALNKLPKGQGYEKLKVNLLKLQGEDKDFAEARLFEFYKEQILVGEKAVVLLSAEDNFREELLEAFKIVEIPASTPQEAYPFYLSHEALLGLEDTPYLCGFHEDGVVKHFVTTQLSCFPQFNSGCFVTHRADITQRRVQSSTVIKHHNAGGVG
jgi:hypothetical protein